MINEDDKNCHSDLEFEERLNRVNNNTETKQKINEVKEYKEINNEKDTTKKN